MDISDELFAYLARAAHGDESYCPLDIDAEWHACLTQPHDYRVFCLTHFGVLIAHVVNPPGHRRGKNQAPCKAIVYQGVLTEEVMR